MIDIETEFWRAIRFAKGTPFEFPFPVRQQWGIARVEYWGERLYEPANNGKAIAFIVPVVEGGDLIDLCAIDCEHPTRWAQRMGYGHGLGLDAVEKARQRCCDLLLLPRPIDWLRAPIVSSMVSSLPVEPVHLFTLKALEITLDDVPQILCADVEFSERVQAFLPPSQRARVVLEQW